MLIASRARDGYAVLAVLHGRELTEAVEQASALLATVLGQDLDPGEDGVFRTARRVAKDRVISTVDPDARHGHKTASRGFDGYKGHAAMDPDSRDHHCHHGHPGQHRGRRCRRGPDHRPPRQHRRAGSTDGPGTDGPGTRGEQEPIVYGDAAYGTGEFHEQLGGAGIESRCKTQAPTARGVAALFSKDRFGIDLGCDDRDLPGRGQRPDPGAPQR